MPTTAPARAAEHAQADPYALRPEDARPAPETFRDRLRHLGPGFVLSAAVVGSGELITTTALGAKAGFALLWLVVVSTAVKVWVQMELARWTILNGRTALEGYREVGPRIGRLSWINWLWIGMDFAKMFQRGGIIGGTAAACSVLWPIIGEPLSWGSLALWAVVVTVAAILLLQSGKYSLVERACLVSVVVFTLITVSLAVGLPGTEFGYGTSELGGGFGFEIPAGTVGIALAVFGITGVGADEMTTYTYWCLEKGYARWTGPDDGSEERARRAAGWIKVMRLDTLAGLAVCVLCTLSFYVIGAAAPPAGPRARGQRDDHHVVADLHRHHGPLGRVPVPRRRRGRALLDAHRLDGLRPPAVDQHPGPARRHRLERRPRPYAHHPHPHLVPAAGVDRVLPLGPVTRADGADRRHRRRDLPAGRSRRRLAPAPHRGTGALPHQSVADRGARRQQRRDPVRRRVRRPENRRNRRRLRVVAVLPAARSARPPRHASPDASGGGQHLPEGALGAGARRRALWGGPSAGPSQGASPHRHGA